MAIQYTLFKKAGQTEPEKVTVAGDRTYSEDEVKLMAKLQFVPGLQVNAREGDDLVVVFSDGSVHTFKKFYLFQITMVGIVVDTFVDVTDQGAHTAELGLGSLHQTDHDGSDKGDEQASSPFSVSSVAAVPAGVVPQAAQAPQNAPAAAVAGPVNTGGTDNPFAPQNPFLVDDLFQGALNVGSKNVVRLDNSAFRENLFTTVVPVGSGSSDPGTIIQRNAVFSQLAHNADGTFVVAAVGQPVAGGQTLGVRIDGQQALIDQKLAVNPLFAFDPNVAAPIKTNPTTADRALEFNSNDVGVFTDATTGNHVQVLVSVQAVIKPQNIDVATAITGISIAPEFVGSTARTVFANLESVQDHIDTVTGSFVQRNLIAQTSGTDPTIDPVAALTLHGDYGTITVGRFSGDIKYVLDNFATNPNVQRLVAQLGAGQSLQEVFTLAITTGESTLGNVQTSNTQFVININGINDSPTASPAADPLHQIPQLAFSNATGLIVNVGEQGGVSNGFTQPGNPVSINFGNVRTLFDRTALLDPELYPNAVDMTDKPFTTNASTPNAAIVYQASHGLHDGDSVLISPNKADFKLSDVQGTVDEKFIQPLTMGAGNSLHTLSGSGLVTLEFTKTTVDGGHQLKVGDPILLGGFADTNGILKDQLNGVHTILSVTPTTISFQTTGTATAHVGFPDGGFADAFPVVSTAVVIPPHEVKVVNANEFSISLDNPPGTVTTALSTGGTDLQIQYIYQNAVGLHPGEFQFLIYNNHTADKLSFTGDLNVDGDPGVAIGTGAVSLGKFSSLGGVEINGPDSVLPAKPVFSATTPNIFTGAVSTINGSPEITIAFSDPAHILQAGQTVVLSGFSDIAGTGITAAVLNGTHIIKSVSGTNFTFIASSSATASSFSSGVVGKVIEESVFINGQYGTLEFHADGSYTYTRLTDAIALPVASATPLVGETSVVDHFTVMLRDVINGTHESKELNFNLNTVAVNSSVSGQIGGAGTNDPAAFSNVPITGHTGFNITKVETLDGIAPVQSAASAADATLTIVGKYGTLEINRYDGSYKYMLAQDSGTPQGDAAQALTGDESTLVTDSFRYTVADGNSFDVNSHFHTDSAVLKIAVVGANDTPVVDSVLATKLSEQTDGSKLTTNIDVTFHDVDGGNTHTPTIAVPVVSGGTTRSGLTTDASLVVTPTILTESSAGSTGHINLAFAAGSSVFDYLAVNEHVDLTYTLQVSDGHSLGVTTQTVGITISGTNDAPVITDHTSVTDGTVSVDGVVTEDVAVSANFLNTSGTISFVDRDFSDSHTVLPVVKDAGNLLGGILTVPTDPFVKTDSQNGATGTVDWAYKLDNTTAVVQALAEGQIVQEKFTVTIDDGHGGTDSRQVVIDVHGSNDPAIIASIAQKDLTEQADTSLLNSTLPVTFTDLDVIDTHKASISVTSPSVVPAGGPDNATLAGLLTPGTVTEPAGATPGKFDLNFSAASGVFDYLAKDEVVTVNYRLTLDDSHASGAVTKDFVVTVTGTNDAPTVKAHTDGSVTEDTFVTANHLDSTGTITFKDVDFTDTHTVSSIADGANKLGGALIPTIGTDATSGVSGTVNWAYSVDNTTAVVQALAEGQTVQEKFTVTVDDGHGGTVPQVITIDVHGSNDAPVITTPIADQNLNEQTTNSALTNTKAVSFTDIDLADTGHTASITHVTASGTLGAFLATDDATLLAFETPASVVKTAGGSAGSLNLNFSAASTALDYLNVGDTLSLDYTLAVSDTHGGTTSAHFNVIISGANDAPVLDLNGAGAGINDSVIFDAKTASSMPVPVAIVNPTVTIADPDNTTLSGATITLTKVLSTDTLAVGTLPGGIAGSVTTNTATQAIVTLTGSGTLAAYQTALQAITFTNTNNLNNAGDLNDRTITLTVKDAGAADSLLATATVHVNKTNDAPTLAATSLDPTFNEGVGAAQGAPVAVFSSASVDTIEFGQTLTRLKLTVDSLQDGSNEKLSVDGSQITLTNGASGTTATNGMSFSVAVAAGTATVTLTKAAGISSSAMQTLVNGIAYQDTNVNDPTSGTRTVTLTEIKDNGGTANGGHDTTTLSIASSVTVAPVNDAPTLSATVLNPTFNEGAGGAQGVAKAVFSSAAANTVEAGQTHTQFKLTVSGLVDTANEKLTVDGTQFSLTDLTNGTTATNGMTFAVSVAAGTATVTFTKVAGISSAALQTLVNGIAYQDTNVDDPTAGTRSVTLTEVKDSGGTANGGVDTTALSIASNVAVTPVNDKPTLTTTADNPTFTEGAGSSQGAAVNVFHGTTASTVEAGQTHTELKLTVGGLVDGANEKLTVDGTQFSLTNGTNGTTTTNSMTFAVSVSAGTATVTLTKVAGISDSALQTLVDGIAYQDTNIDAPTAGTRTVTLTETMDNGGTANGGVDTAALNHLSNVLVVAVNDAPTANSVTTPASYTEAANASGAENLGTNKTGTLSVTDVDVPHQTLTGVIGTPALAWSGGTLVDPQLATLTTALGTGKLTFDNTVTSTGSAQTIPWTYNPANSVNLDFLAQGETLTVTYAVKVNDGLADSVASQNVVITINGTNDAPTVVSPTIGGGLHNTAIAVTAAGLGVNDLDASTHANVDINVTVGTFGHFELTTNVGAAVTLFTLADVEAGHVVFQHVGNAGDTPTGWSVSANDHIAAATAPVAVSFASFTPVALDLDGHGIQYQSLAQSTQHFDVNNNGVASHIAWVGGSSGLLAFDGNHDGLITDRSEIAFTDHAPGAKTDMEALRIAFDTNHDGVLDAKDAQFSSFGVWSDLNHDGVFAANEFRSLHDAGINSISLVTDNVASVPVAGVYVAGASSFTFADGHIGTAADVMFASEAAHTATTGTAAGSLTAAPAEIDPGALHSVVASATIQPLAADVTATAAATAHPLEFTVVAHAVGEMVPLPTESYASLQLHASNAPTPADIAHQGPTSAVTLPAMDEVLQHTATAEIHLPEAAPVAAPMAGTAAPAAASVDTSVSAAVASAGPAADAGVAHDVASHDAPPPPPAPAHDHVDAPPAVV